MALLTVASLIEIRRKVKAFSIGHKGMNLKAISMKDRWMARENLLMPTALNYLAPSNEISFKR
jgi:hypothetical protein